MVSFSHPFIAGREGGWCTSIISQNNNTRSKENRGEAEELKRREVGKEKAAGRRKGAGARQPLQSWGEETAGQSRAARPSRACQWAERKTEPQRQGGAEEHGLPPVLTQRAKAAPVLAGPSGSATHPRRAPST